MRNRIIQFTEFMSLSSWRPSPPVEITGGRCLRHLPQRSFALFSAGFISFFFFTRGNRSANSKPIWGSVVADLLSHVQLFCNPMNCSSPGSSVQGFPRQEYWSGLPFPSHRDFPNPGIEPASPPFAGRLFTAEPPGKPRDIVWDHF